MVPVVAGFALAFLRALDPKLIAFAVLLRAAGVGASAAFYVSFDSFPIDYDGFNGFEALLMVLRILLKKVVSFGYVFLVVKAVSAATFVITVASCCKTITIKLKALGLFAIAGRNFGFFLSFFCF